MKLETFFEKFDQLADAPDAVARMRALVFELAVRGRLSERRTSDCTDAKWLNLLKILDAKDSNSQLGHKPIFNIPSPWRWATLNDLGDTKPRNNASDSATCSFVPMTFISAEYGQAVQYEERIWSEVKKGYTHFSNGDVVMAKITPCFENGKSAIVDNLAGGIGAGTTELHVFRRSGTVIDPRFVLLYLKSHGFIERGIPRMTGSAGQKRVPSDYFANSPFPLPPPAEQKRIVAKVDELMALCDRLEAQQKERETRLASLTRAAIARFDEAPTPANLNFIFHPSYSVTAADLRKTILNLAIQGKLVSQDPYDEAAATSLARLGLAQDTGSLAEVVHQGEQIPESWSLVRFEDVAIVTGGVTLGRKLGDRKTVTLPYLRVANVKRGEIDVDVIKEVIIAEDEIERYALRENDLLMTEGGDWDKVGRAAIWSGEISPCLHQNHIFRARMRSAEIKPFWFERYFNSPQGRSYFESASKQTTNLASINMRQVRGCPVPFPPLTEQHRILARVDQLMKLVDKLDRQIAASESTARDLLDAVVHDLLHPSAGVVEFPRSESDRASERAAIGCYAIEHLVRNPSFGHTMNMKVVYMAQAHIGLPLDLKFERQAAGPWHPWIEEFDAMGQSEGWFTVAQKSIGDGHTKYEYAPKAALKQKVAEAAALLGEHRAEFDRLLGFFADMKTVDAEIVATLFAAWNDFLIDGKTPTDDEIIREVRTNWHERKMRFSPALLATWLKWLRKNRLVPQGRGPRTQQQLTLALS